MENIALRNSEELLARGGIRKCPLWPILTHNLHLKNLPWDWLPSFTVHRVPRIIKHWKCLLASQTFGWYAFVTFKKVICQFFTIHSNNYTLSIKLICTHIKFTMLTHKLHPVQHTVTFNYFRKKYLLRWKVIQKCATTVSNTNSFKRQSAIVLNRIYPTGVMKKFQVCRLSQIPNPLPTPLWRKFIGSLFYIFWKSIQSTRRSHRLL